MRYINAIVEDELQENIIRKVLSDRFADNITLNTVYGKSGYSYIKDNIRSFNQASDYIPCIILTDLDLGECPPDLKNKWVKFPLNPNLLFNIVVREAEAWLIADRKNFAAYLGISYKKLPDPPEGIADPKQTLINLAGRSRKRKIRDDIVPEGTARIGSNYNSCLAKFVDDNWDVNVAASNSGSLRRMIEKLSNFVAKKG